MSTLLGQELTVSVTFTNSSSVATDPTTVTLTYGDSSGIPVTLTYGVDAAIVRDSVGVFHAVILPDAAGSWLARWVGTGTVNAVLEDQFDVVSGSQPWGTSPAPYVYASRSSLKEELGISSTNPDYDALLDGYLRAATEYIEQYTGRVFLAAAAATRDYAPADAGDIVYIDEFTSLSLFKISYTGSWDTPTTLTDGTDFLKYPANGPPYRAILRNPITGRYPFPVITIRSGFLIPTAGIKIPTIRVTAVFGNSAAVPELIRTACKRLATRMYKLPAAPFGVVESGGDGNAIRLMVDNDIKMMLDVYRKPLFA